MSQKRWFKYLVAFATLIVLTAITVLLISGLISWVSQHSLFAQQRLTFLQAFRMILSIGKQEVVGLAWLGALLAVCGIWPELLGVPMCRSGS